MPALFLGKPEAHLRHDFPVEADAVGVPRHLVRGPRLRNQALQPGAPALRVAVIDDGRGVLVEQFGGAEQAALVEPMSATPGQGQYASPMAQALSVSRPFREVPRLPVIDAGGFKKAPKEKTSKQTGFEF